MIQSFRPVIIVALCGLAISLISLFIWLQANNPVADTLFGHVTAISADTVTVANRDNVERVITIATSTAFSRGKNKITAKDVEIGNFVHIGLSRVDVNTDIAHFVRIMRSPDKEKNYDEDE